MVTTLLMVRGGPTSMTSACRCLALAVALIVLATGCAAKTNPTASAGSEPPPPVVEVLPNGLTLVVQEHRAADIVAVHLWVATGVRYENPNGLGYAHFQEHMLFKGTDTFGPGYIDRAIEGTGGRSNAFTTYDYTTFQILVPSDAIKTAIGLLDDMAFRSKFDPKEIDAEREVIFEETRIQTDNPQTAIVREAYSAVFGDHPYGRPLLGTPETMKAATQKDLQVFNHKYYTPENMTLVVVGPVQAKAVRAVVDQTFGRRPRTGYTPPPNPSLKPIKEIVRVKVDRPEQQAYLGTGSQVDGLLGAESIAEFSDRRLKGTNVDCNVAHPFDNVITVPTALLGRTIGFLSQEQVAAGTGEELTRVLRPSSYSLPIFGWKRNTSDRYDP
jgi:hypothetical protein